MAKLIKTFKKIKDGAVNVVARDLNIFSGAYSALYNHFDDEVERVYIMLINGSNVLGIVDVSRDGTNGASSVELDYSKVESTLDTVNASGWSFAICHNHPYVEQDGKWVETLISDGDVMVTNMVINVAEQHYPNARYFGHFIVNKEDGGRKKIIYMDEDFDCIKYSKEVIDSIQKGEL